MSTYLEIVDTMTQQSTGGAAFKTIRDTCQAFESCRGHHSEGARYLMDLYISGDLIDTIDLTPESVEFICGAELLGEQTPNHSDDTGGDQ